ncbi:peptidase M14 [Roseomonas sp. WA12]
MDEAFAVRVPVPDLWEAACGNTGIPGVWRLDSGQAGPHAVITCLVHGNEFAGATVLARWLRAGLRPARGVLSLVFANLDAFARFDPADPTLSRYVDEDLNRLWHPSILEGSRDSAELRRARALRPVVEAADVLLDLHSMLWPSDPVMLAGRSLAALSLARAIGSPPVIVADTERPEGPRLIDHPPFTEPGTHRVALLAEAGPHWEPETEAMAEACAAGLLHALGMARPAPMLPLPEPAAAPAVWTVSHCVTAASRHFAFTGPVRGGAVIPRAGTLIARDGQAEIRTPHDDCMLVMPSPRVMRGHVAVRLARRG